MASADTALVGEGEHEDVHDDELADVEDEEESSIHKMRKQLNSNKEKNAAMMIKKHDHKRNKKTVEFKVGDCVSVKIPRIDRTGTSFARLPGKVCKIASHKQQFYGILTQWGILNDNYLPSDLEPYSGVVNVNLDNYEDNYSKLSLTEAARLQGLSTGLVEAVVKTCNCTGVCKSDGRCSCWSNGEKCGSHCHLKLKGKPKKCKNCK